MRGGGEFRSITIEPAADYLGYTGVRAKPCDAAFITYAGPWAEARAQWPLETLDGEDGDGCTFDDYLTAAWLFNADDDASDYQKACATDAALLGGQAQLLNLREETWSRELERTWPVIRQLAARLLAGESGSRVLDP